MKRNNYQTPKSVALFLRRCSVWFGIFAAFVVLIGVSAAGIMGQPPESSVFLSVLWIFISSLYSVSLLIITGIIYVILSAALAQFDMAENTQPRDSR